MNETISILEKEARCLRDLVYGSPSGDINWEACKEKWVAQIAWLRQVAAPLLHCTKTPTFD